MHYIIGQSAPERSLDMDDLTLRLSELESQNEDMEKMIGKLTAQSQLHEEKLQQLSEKLRSVTEAQTEMIQEQLNQKKRMRVFRKRLDELSSKTGAMQDASAKAAEEFSTLQNSVQDLSADMDALYTDMNALVKETRARGAQMKAEMERFFWDAEENRYQNDGDTMW